MRPKVDARRPLQLLPPTTSDDVAKETQRPLPLLLPPKLTMNRRRRRSLRMNRSYLVEWGQPLKRRRPKSSAADDDDDDVSGDWLKPLQPRPQRLHDLA